MKDTEITLERVVKLFSDKEWAELQKENLFEQLGEIADRVGTEMIEGSADKNKMFKVFQEEMEKFESVYIKTKSESERQEYLWILDIIENG